MVDTVTRETRSRMMAAIRSRDTKPELAVRRSLHALGFRYRLHVRIGKARPDIVLPMYRAAVFVHGCFWHGHDDCSLSRPPKSNVAFWTTKIDGNRKRDAVNVSQLLDGGWRVAVVWECAVRDGGGEAVAETLADWLRSREPRELAVRSEKSRPKQEALDGLRARSIELGS